MSGFSFGNTTLGGNSQTGSSSAGFNLGATTTPSTGLGAGGFNLGGSTGTTPGTGLGAATGFKIGGVTPSATTTQATLSLGNTSLLGNTATTGLKLNIPARSEQATSAGTGTGGFNFSAGLGVATTPATQVNTLSGLLGSTAKTATPAAATLGGSTSTTATPGGLGIGLGLKTTSGLGGLGSGGLGTGGLGAGTTGLGAGTTGLGTATGGLSTGLTLGIKATTTATPSTGLSLGGLGTGLTGGLGTNTIGLNSATKAGTATTAVTTTASRGLGGVDSKTTVSASGNVGTDGKASDSKTIKETGLPNELLTTVDNFKKYVKGQKSVREDIARMSSKQMFRVQEDVASLKQLLSLVSNGLQRNTMSIAKLKMESAQELKNAEIAQRTKDTPPGLQYENNAPAEYFQRLVQEFEMRMIIYRQQIEEMESHLMSLQQPSVLLPQELTAVLRKMHESFIALAAQLQVVHENVKAQKEHYLNYRKVFHGDRTNVFETHKKTIEKTNSRQTVASYGPTPFTGMSNQAAVAMAIAMNRSQQPAGAPPTLGLNVRPLATNNTLGGIGQTATLGTGLGLSSGFGSTSFGTATTTQSTGFGSTFGSSFSTPNMAAVKPLGGAMGGGLFGASAGVTPSTTGGLFGTPGGLGAGGLAGSSTPAVGGLNFGNTATATPGQQAFQLQKPPPGGNKRGKKS